MSYHHYFFIQRDRLVPDTLSWHRVQHHRWGLDVFLSVMVVKKVNNKRKSHEKLAYLGSHSHIGPSAKKTTIHVFQLK